MTYEEALKYIHNISWTGSRPGLERISLLLEMMGNPQRKLKFIHVAGTNGKGSFCAMLASVLKSAGYKTGLYTSPYVRYFNERMSIDGQMIENAELAELVSYVKQFADKMQDPPTEFELICAVAFEYFYRNSCELVVLEVGLGGRLDATNIIDSSVLSVITGISLDHTSILGDTVEKIAKEKAGICKKGVPMLFGGVDREAGEIISDKAQELGCKFFTTDYSRLSDVRYGIDGTDFSYGERRELEIKLLGEYQPRNAASVLCAVDILNECGIEISENAVREGLSKTVWQARFELVSKDPVIIFDGGHNPEGVSAAIKSVKAYFPDSRVRVISGVMRDKNYTYIAKKISEVACEAFTVAPRNERALDASEYAGVLLSEGTRSYACSCVSEALELAIRSSRQDRVPILALGSLYMYEEFMTALEQIKLRGGEVC